ncbi:MAG: SCO family protein [Gallionellaceae bacterium]|jgi:protein SCO1/2|nr:SCO family protein [Gallionellaceae bacterium]
MWLRNLLVLLLAVLLAGCEKPRLPSPFHANDVTPIFTRADFHLIDHNGKPRALADFRGKAVVLFFGYTHCPDVCPTTLADLAQVMKLLGNDAGKVQVLFITVDPERDKPEMLAKFVPSFHPSFLALYGDEQATAQAAKSFYVGYQKRPTTSGYNMDHTTGAFLIDPNGKVRLRAPHAQRADWLAEDIRLLLTGV